MEVDIQKVVRYALGTCKSETEIAEHFGINEENVLDMLSENNVERCESCEWWYEAGELVDEDGEVVGCNDCRNLISKMED